MSVDGSQDPEEIPEVLVVVRVHDAMSTCLPKPCGIWPLVRTASRESLLLGRRCRGLQDKDL